MSIDVKAKLRQFSSLKSDRSNWESHWQEIADLVLPTREFGSTTSQGIKRNNKLFDATAALACSESAAALHGLMCNPAIPWVHIGLFDQDDGLDEDGKFWLFDSSFRVLRYFSSAMSGFATNVHEVFLDDMAFGTGVMLARESEGVLRFQARQLSNFYMCESDAGFVTDIHVCMKIRAKDLPTALGLEPSKFSENTQKKIKSEKSEDYESVIEVLHCVGRRSEYDPTMRGKMNMPWYSAYIEVEAKHLIDEGGLLRNPYLTPRWSKAPMETYGRSPAMDVLPAIKGINAIKKDLLIAGQLMTRPPMNIPANGMEGPFKYFPGAINYMRAGTRDKPEPMVTNFNGLKDGRDLMEDDRNAINSAYFLDALKLPELDRMTAEEVITRRQQGLIKVSPALSRMEQELLDPVVTLVFNWLKRTGRLLPTPASVSGRALKPYYTNPMSIAQRASQSQNFLQAMQTANALLVGKPDVFEVIDDDFTLRDIFGMFNNNPKMLRKPAVVKQLRADRAKLQAAASGVSLAQGGAAAAKDAASALKDARAQ